VCRRAANPVGLRLRCSQLSYREVNRTDEALGRFSYDRVLRDRHCGFLKRAKFLKARNRIAPSGGGGLYEPLGQLACQAFIEAGRHRGGQIRSPVLSAFEGVGGDSLMTGMGGFC
jgi:hypothetical protein